MLPTDYKARKALPLYTYLTQYHPDAILELVKVAVAGNQQHNPGEPLHWAQGKSMDQLNTAERHIFDHGQGNVYDTADIPYLEAAGIPDSPGTMHLAKAAWRLLAEIQLLCDARAAGLQIEEMVRGTHEFRGDAEPEPKSLAEIEKDYPRLGDHIHRGAYDGVAVPLKTHYEHRMPPPIETAIGPGQVAPIAPQAQLPPSSVALPMPPVKKISQGRLLPCGCFGLCSGWTPNCPNWVNPPEDPSID